MTVTNTSLLGLALPTTGTESGVWGDDVNNGLTILIDVSVAGTNNITQDSDITLAVSNGNNSSSFTSTATNSAVAQYYVLNCSGARTALRNIIVPTTSKTYVVTNGTTGGFGITVKKSGGTGVTVAAGETAIVFYNTVTGDVAKVTSTVNVSSFSAGTTGLTPSTATTGAVTLAGTLATTNGGTGLTSFTANGVVYASSTSALATGSALYFDGTNLGVGTTSPATKLHVVGTGALARVTNTSATGYATLQTFNDSGINASFGMGGSTASLFANSAFIDVGGVYPIVFAINDVEKMRLDSSGNLGIGTSSPAAKLDVNGAAYIKAGNVLRLYRPDNGTYGDISHGASGTGLVYNDANGDSHVWQLGGTTAMLLNSSGNLGLGVTPSASYTGYKTFQIASQGVISADTVSNGALEISDNSYRNSASTPTYINSFAATLYTQYRGEQRWYNAPSGTAGAAITFTQAMTLDASGRLLVSTTSSTGTNAKLVVGAGNSNSDGVIVANTANGTYSGLTLSNWTGITTTNGPYITFDNSGVGGWAIGSGNGVNTFDFCQTWGTPLVRIDSIGNLLVGTTNTAETAGIGFKLLTGGQVACVTTANTTNAQMDTYELYSTGAGAFRFYVGAGGTIFATSIVISAISDQRLKENVRDIDTGLDSIMALKPRRFDWKEGKGQDKKDVAGFIAQEFETVFPECVSTSKAGEDGIEYKNINHETLIPTLVKAMQEQQAIIESLKARLDAANL